MTNDDLSGSFLASLLLSSKTVGFFANISASHDTQTRAELAHLYLQNLAVPNEHEESIRAK